MRQVELSLTEAEWNKMIDALLMAATHHRGCAKRIRNSGYGRATTIEKADKHLEKAAEYGELADQISQRLL